MPSVLCGTAQEPRPQEGWCPWITRLQQCVPEWLVVQVSHRWAVLPFREASGGPDPELGWRTEQGQTTDHLPFHILPGGRNLSPASW